MSEIRRGSAPALLSFASESNGSSASPTLLPSVSSINWSIKFSHELPTWPTNLSVLDPDDLAPLKAFDEEAHRIYYDSCPSSGIAPPKPDQFTDPFLQPVLTRSERKRLTSLWYLTRDISSDRELQASLTKTAEIVQTALGYDSAIIGFVDLDQFVRFATANMPLALLPRRESTCSHTINRALLVFSISVELLLYYDCIERSGTVLSLPRMKEDWRFAQSPNARSGLASYAGTQLRYVIDEASGQEVALGSLCVANFTPAKPLTPAQEDMLVHFARLIVGEIVSRARLLRNRERDRMAAVLEGLHSTAAGEDVTASVLAALRNVYPKCRVSMQFAADGQLHLFGKSEPVSFDAAFSEHLYEDATYIESLISDHNHAAPSPAPDAPTLRAVAHHLRPFEHSYILMETNDLRFVFDDLDVWFLRTCGLFLSSFFQEQALVKATAAKESFLRSLRHEILTPIHGILASCELLLDTAIQHDQQKNEGQTVLLDVIDNSARGLLKIVSHVLDLNRLEDVKLSSSASLLDLYVVERDVMESQRLALTSSKAKKVLLLSDNQIQSEHRMAFLDKRLLTQCLSCLMQNAVDFTSAGSVLLTTSRSEEGNLLYDIVDTGIGIASTDQERIFEPFEKVDPYRRGVGLSLTVGAKLAKALNGSVRLLSSTVGQGSHFQIELVDPGLTPDPKTLTAAADFSSMHYRTSVDLFSPTSIYLTKALERWGVSRVASDSAARAIIVWPASSIEKSASESVKKASPFDIIIALVSDERELKELRDLIDDHPVALRIVPCQTPVTALRVEACLQQVLVFWNEVISPVVSPSERPRSFILPRPEQIAPSSKPVKFKVLCVDDNPTNLAILCMYCEKRKFPYVKAMDGEQAVTQFTEAVQANQPFDLVFMDLQMPRKDGIEATKDIRALELTRRLSRTAILMITGQSLDQDEQESYLAGATRFFAKPLRLKALDEFLTAHFGASTQAFSSDSRA